MNGKGFTSVMWVAAIGAAALICYMFSMRVAEERAGLAQLESQIRRAEQSIRTLKTELGTRSRVHQLQHWASADFGFVAPTSSQFMADEITLANLDMPAAEPVMEAPVRMAAAPAAPAAQPKPAQAVAPAPAPAKPTVRRASTTPAAQPALLRRASVETPAKPKLAAATAAATRTAAPKPRAAPAPARTARAAPASDRAVGRPR